MLIRFSLTINFGEHGVWLEKLYSGDVPPNLESVSVELEGPLFKVGATTWYPVSNEMWVSLNGGRPIKTEDEFWEEVQGYVSDGWNVCDGSSAYVTRKHLLLKELDEIDCALTDDPNEVKNAPG